jgi:hypothetical protein
VLDVRLGVGPGHDVRVAVVAVAAPGLVVVGDVAGGLLEVGGQPTPLDALGQQVRHVLEGHVGAPELGDGVVAVLAEDLLVEPFGALRAGGLRGGGARLELRGELVDQQPPQALRRARVAGEQRPLDHLGQRRQAEDVPVEVGDVAGEQLTLGGGEVLGHAGSSRS